MATTATGPAVRARDAVLFAVQDALVPVASAVTVSADAGAFHPQPLGVLIGLPSLVSRTLAARTYDVPVHVVSADPLNDRSAVESLFELADALVLVLGVATYAATDWPGGVNRDPLPSVYLLATITVPEQE